MAADWPNVVPMPGHLRLRRGSRKRRAEQPGPEEVQDLRARLDRERNGRIRAEEELGDNSQDLADARAILEQLERRCKISERNLAELRQKLLLAWTESGELRRLLDAREA